MQKKKLLIVCPYPIGESPSQRFRFEQYFNVLEKKNVVVITKPFYDLKTWHILYTNGHFIDKVAGIMIGFWSRLLLLSTVKKYDFIFIHREATPLGPPWFEWVTAKIFHKRIIYDFDDAIWLPHVSSENKGIRFLKWHRKIGLLCKWSDKVSCGNAFLCDFAKHYNKNVFLNPTTIDTQSVHNPNHGAMVKSNRLTIGWTGTHSTLKYLKLLQQVLVRLQLKYSDKIDVVVIADRPPEMNIDYTFIKWSKNTEITDLLRFDIGIMPLEDDEWAKGKCGFKALQYMALKIPTIASAVGVNTTIIKNQDTGLLCTTELEWELALISLIENPALRQRLGERGRQTVEAHYSTSSNQDNFLSFFE